MTSLKNLFHKMGRYVCRGRDIVATEGLAILVGRILDRLKRISGLPAFGNFDRGYQKWRSQYGLAVPLDQAEALIKSMMIRPTFSIIMPVYNVDLKWLEKAIDSVRNQSYPDWQLCIVDDASSGQELKQFLKSVDYPGSKIQVQFNSENTGIGRASSTALEMADGDFIGLLDHDDLLAEDALLCNASLINRYPELDIVYSDEDKVDLNEKFKTPFFKPDYSPERLHAQNYIGHFVVLRKSLVDKVGGFKAGFDGAQDYELILRVSAVTNKIHHIPKVLYHWREVSASTSASYSSKSYAWEAGRLALQDHFNRTEPGTKAILGKHPGTYRRELKSISTPNSTSAPKISIIIPFKDQPELLHVCLHSVFANANKMDLEVIAINNNSIRPETQNAITHWSSRNLAIRFVDYPDKFNFSAICNYGVAQAHGEYIVLMNSDIEITDSNWIGHLLDYAQHPETGAVGAKLLFPNQTVQHAGIVVGIDSGAGHPFKHFPKNHPGYFLSLDLPHNVSAVSAAFLMVRREKYLEVRGLDESKFAVAYNDVDFCLKLLNVGYRNVYTPYCTAIHRESSTRGLDLGAEKKHRHDLEKRRLQKKWGEFFAAGDPYYNRNLTLAREDYTLNHRSSTQS